MEYIEFEGIKAMKVVVESGDHSSQTDLKHLKLKEGLCLYNSFKIAEIRKCKLVEGFLVTEFEDKLLECVGHVWNEIEDRQIDYTVGLKKHNEKVKSQNYFKVESYNYMEKNTEKRTIDGRIPTVFEKGIVPVHDHIVFRTNVNLKELEVRENLWKIEAK